MDPNCHWTSSWHLGPNGHYYAYINTPAGLTWSDANARAPLTPPPVPGLATYLATVTSAEEEAFIESIVSTATFTTSSRWGPWLGGYQDHSDPNYSEPLGGWKWVTSEPWGYAKWGPGEPNNSSGGEDFLHMASYDGGISVIWNDYPNDPVASLGLNGLNNAAPGYVVEASVKSTTLQIASTPQYFAAWIFSDGSGPADVISSDFGIFPPNPSAPIYLINGTFYSPTDPNFTGWWSATYTFSISSLDTSVPQTISVRSQVADDRAVFILNGQQLFATGLGAPGTGQFQFEPNGQYSPVAFNYLTGAFNGTGSYLVNGTNTLKVIVNNTGNGIFGGVFSYGPSYFNVDAQFTFNGLQ